MKNFNSDKFQNELLTEDWAFLNTCIDPNSALDNWIESFSKVIDANAPLKQKRVKRSKQPEWLNEEIVHAMASRQKAYNNKHVTESREEKNKINRLIHKAKQDFFQNLITLM